MPGVILTYEGQVLLDEKRTISRSLRLRPISIRLLRDETKLTVRVLDGTREMIAYTPAKKEILKVPDPAEAAKDPEEIMSNEELFPDRDFTLSSTAMRHTARPILSGRSETRPGRYPDQQCIRFAPDEKRLFSGC